MPDIRDELTALVHSFLDSAKPTEEDRHNALLYAKGLAEAIITAKLDPSQKDAALKAAQGYRDALELMVARYEVRTAILAEKRIFALVNRAVAIAIAAAA